MSKKSTPESRAALAVNYGIDPKVLEAIIHVETPGYGFHPTTGNILINFEPSWFKKYSNIIIPDGDWSQTSQWVAYNKARAVYPEYTRLSTSYGLPQIMGFNYKACGYASTISMVEDFLTGEDAQLEAMMKFLKSNKKLYKAIVDKDWNLIAYYYNGSGYRMNNYHVKLKNYYDAQQ